RRHAFANPVFGHRCANTAEQTLGFALPLSIKRMREAKSKPSRGFNLDGEIGDYIRHQRLIDQSLLEGAAPGHVMGGLRKRMTHQAGRPDTEVEPRIMVHFQAFSYPVAGLADKVSDHAAKFDFGGGIGLVAAFVLQTLDLQSVARSIRQPAWRDEARDAFL